MGDAAFQKKHALSVVEGCLGKMGDVAKEGRTVLEAGTVYGSSCCSDFSGER